MRQALSFFYRHFIIRDIDINRYELLCISFLLSGVVVLLTSLIYSVWGKFPPTRISIDERTIYIIGIITLIVTGVWSGVLIDKLKSKIKWAFWILGLASVSLFFMNTNIEELTLYILGVIICCFSILFLFIEIITLLITLTSIMERARVTAGVLICVGVTTLMTIEYMEGLQLYNYSFLLLFVFLGLAGVSAWKANWRLDTDKFNGRLTREFIKQGILQYSTFFFGLSFLLGVSIDALKVDYVFMGIMMIPWALISAILLDNVGRKGTIILTVLLLAIYIVFSGSTFHYSTGILSGIFGMVLIELGILVVVLTGDLASPAIRGRVLSLNGLVLVGGFILGFVIRNEIFTELGPDNLLILNDATSFILILLVIWLIPLKDTLTNRDISYRDRILQIYVNNFNGINLFFRDTTQSTTLNEDLVSGGLTGIAAMVEEITQSNDKPSSIESGNRTIMLEYGRYVVIALVVKRGLYVLRQKMKSFIKEFEEIFEPELRKDTGEVTRFDSTKYLVQKYFKIQ